MSASTSSTPYNVLEETGDDFIDSFQLPVRFKEDCVEHTRRITDISRGVRNAIHVEQWRRKKELGRGGFGIVYLESTKGGHQLRAVKEVPKYNGRTKTMNHLREVLAMAHFRENEAFFVKLEGWYQSSSHIFIAMEYLEHGDLSGCVFTALPEPEVQNITHQLIEALESMHVKKFTHRDLKPSNVFVVSRAPNWWVKLGDFGVSKRVRNDSTSMHTSIETDYTAPEIRGFILVEDEASHYTNAVDMWSLGCLVHWLLTLKLPLSTREMFPYCSSRKEFPRKHLEAQGSTAEALDFLTKLIQPWPEDRLTASNALKHGWPQELKLESSANQEFSALATAAAPKEPNKGIAQIKHNAPRAQIFNGTADFTDPKGTIIGPKRRSSSWKSPGLPDSESSAHRTTPNQTLAHETGEPITVFAKGAVPALNEVRALRSEPAARLSWKLQRTLEGHSDWVCAVAFSPDGKQIASASDDGTVRLWDSATGAARNTLEGHSGYVRAVAFSPDGKQIASASGDGTVRLWDSATGAARNTLEGHSDYVHAVAFSPDGKQIASASWDRKVRLWDSTRGAAAPAKRTLTKSLRELFR